MTCRTIITAATVSILVAAPRVSAAQQFTKPARITAVAAPSILDTAGLFQDRAVRVGEDVFVAGQPTPRALRWLHEQGVTTVVNLRTEIGRASCRERV